MALKKVRLETSDWSLQPLSAAETRFRGGKMGDFG